MSHEPDPLLLDGRNARRLMRRKARTFFLASLFLPPAVRIDVHIVYTFCRIVDDLVDERPAGWRREDALAWLQRLEGGVLGTHDDPLLRELSEVIERRRVPPALFGLLFQGARFDLDMVAIETLTELRQYSLWMAGSVGMIMAHLLGCRDEGALQAACDLGMAMQITNVLRDVGEDLDRNRVYLPWAELAVAGVSHESLHARSATPAFRQAAALVAAEARALYRSGVAGIRHLDRSVQFAIFLAATLYEGILDKIERNDYDVFSRRAHLGTVEKWALTVPTYLQHRQQRVLLYARD